MSVHPSLSSKGKGKRIRSVLKRFERLKELLEKEKWKQGDSVFALPKLKALRWKIKKSKAKLEEEQAAAAAGAAAEAAGEASAAAGAKPKEAKASAAKKEEKKEKR